jgi:hypothetical protein
LLLLLMFRFTLVLVIHIRHVILNLQIERELGLAYVLEFVRRLTIDVVIFHAIQLETTKIGLSLLPFAAVSVSTWLKCGHGIELVRLLRGFAVIAKLILIC